jgi:ribosomal protein S18 acetylase RimI-like enzyme
MAPEAGKVEYRQLRRSDLPFFEGVALQSLGTFERTTGLDALALSQFQSLRNRWIWTFFIIQKGIGGLLGLSQTLVFVGAEEGRVVGTASVIMLQNAGYIVGVATDAPSRGRGIATALLDRVRVAAQKKGKAWLALDVESDNETAIRLYQKSGFRERSRFAWYVGPVPTSDVVGDKASVELGVSKYLGAAQWVGRHRPRELQEALPATARRLSHLEIVTQNPGAPVKTWELSSSGQVIGVVRASYLPTIRTGVVIPAAWEQLIDPGAVRSLLAGPMNWLRALGASRIVVAVADVHDPWDATVSGLGLTYGVSTTLMIRPVSMSGR